MAMLKQLDKAGVEYLSKRLNLPFPILIVPDDDGPATKAKKGRQ